MEAGRGSRGSRVLLVALAALLAGSASATVYYVSLSGNDANNGLDDSPQGGANGPWRTLLTASSRVLAGDTLYIRGGVYAGGDYIHPNNGTAVARVTFRNHPGEAPIIDCEGLGAGYRGLDHTYANVIGIVVVNAQGQGGGISFNTGSFVVVDSCTVSNIGPYATDHGKGIMPDHSRDCIVRNCLLRNIYNTGASGAANGAGIMAYDTQRLVMENCEIYDSTTGIYDKGVNAYSTYRRNYVHDVNQGIRGNQAIENAVDQQYCENILVPDSASITSCMGYSGLQVYNNTLYNGDISICPNQVLQRTQIWNNISYFSSPSSSTFHLLENYEQDISYCDYNCYYPFTGGGVCPRIRRDGSGPNRRSYESLAAWQAGEGFDLHGLNSNPQFVDAAGGDFHLQTGSACRNAGVNRSTGLTDRDIGAYPFGNTTIVGRIPTGTPSISITSPTSSGTYTSSSATVNLGGTAADAGGSVTSVTWANSRGGSGTASGTTSWSISAVTLQTGANVITVTAHDGDGNAANAVITVTYAVAAPDTTPPAVSAQSPAPGATGVAQNTILRFHVTDASGVNQATLVLRVNGTDVGPTVTGASTDLTVTYDPPTDFAAGVTVTVAVEADDLAATPNHLSTSWSFTCVDPGTPDTTPPYAEQESPAANATGVARNTVIRFHLRDAQSGVDASSIVLRVGGTQVTPVTSGTAQDLTVTYDPPVDFGAAASVAVSVTASDEDGNAMASLHVWSFTTGEETIPPPPAPTAVEGIPGSDTITVTFTASAGANVAGYRVYVGMESGEYGEPIDIGAATFCVLRDLHAGHRYYIAVTAYDTADQESEESEEISVTTLGGAATVERLTVEPNRIGAGSIASVHVKAPSSFDAAPVAVFSVSGQPVGSLSLETVNGYSEAWLDGGWAMGEGVYIFTVEAGGTRLQARLVVAP